MSLAKELSDAAVYAVAKECAVGLISIDNEGVTAIARAVTVAVLDELASREDWLREVSPEDETTDSRYECTTRILNYREAADQLRKETTK